LGPTQQSIPSGMCTAKSILTSTIAVNWCQSLGATICRKALFSIYSASLNSDATSVALSWVQIHLWMLKVLFTTWKVGLKVLLRIVTYAFCYGLWTSTLYQFAATDQKHGCVSCICAEYVWWFRWQQP
jgi:hypothetical protein